MARKILLLFITSLFACRADAPAPAGSAGISAGADSQARTGDTGAAAVDSPSVDSPSVDSLTAGSRSSHRRSAILFLGTSLTAGYGVGEAAAFPALIAARIDSAGLPYRVVNAGISGETSAGGLARLDWSLQDSIAVLVLELGGNDGLRGLPVEQMRANLDAILRRTRTRYPDVELVIAGMEAPPNLGRQYTTEFRNTFRVLAREHDAALVPFLLEGVAAEPSLNQSDGIHPNVAGHRILADNVWRVLEPILQREASLR